MEQLLLMILTFCLLMGVGIVISVIYLLATADQVDKATNEVSKLQLIIVMIIFSGSVIFTEPAYSFFKDFSGQEKTIFFGISYLSLFLILYLLKNAKNKT